MTPVDPAVIRRKLALIINNLQALESIRDIAPPDIVKTYFYAREQSVYSGKRSKPRSI